MVKSFRDHRRGGIALLGSRSRPAHEGLEESEGCWVFVVDGDERDHVTLGEDRDEEVDGDVRDAVKELVNRGCHFRSGVLRLSSLVVPVIVIVHASCV